LDLSSFIDHTNLRPDARICDIEKLCREASENHFASVCVNPCHVKSSSIFLKGSGVAVCTVAGFPLGANTTEEKIFEARNAAENGASEIDMVINLSWIKDGYFNFAEKEIGALVKSVPDCRVKVIIETCLLSRDEIKTSCSLIAEAGAHFVKTSTGFSSGGATIEDVAFIRSIVSDSLGIKASGGIRDYETAAAMVKAGATRLGTSLSMKIINKL